MVDQFIKGWLPVFVWAGFIFYLSSQANLNVGFSRIWEFLLTKLVHLGEYAFLALLLIRALRPAQLPKDKFVWLAVLLALGYAVSDEYHQYFVPGREASLGDLAIDGLGIALTAWLNKLKMIK